MKVFKVYPDRYSWDEYKSFICLAKSKEEILTRMEIDEYGTRYFCGLGSNVSFDQDQGEIHIEEVNLNVDMPCIICRDYN